MSSVSAIASSGLRAAQLRMDTSAHNVANLNTPGFQRQTVNSEAVAGPGGVAASAGRVAQAGVAVESEAVEQIAATYAFKASLQLLRTDDRMRGALLDERA